MSKDKHIEEPKESGQDFHEFHILSSQEKLLKLAGDQFGKNRNAQEKIASLLLLNKLEMQSTLILIDSLSHKRKPIESDRVRLIQESARELSEHASSNQLSKIQEDIAALSKAESSDKQIALLNTILDDVRAIKKSLTESHG